MSDTIGKKRQRETKKEDNLNIIDVKEVFYNNLYDNHQTPSPSTSNNSKEQESIVNSQTLNQKQENAKGSPITKAPPQVKGRVKRRYVKRSGPVNSKISGRASKMTEISKKAFLDQNYPNLKEFQEQAKGKRKKMKVSREYDIVTNQTTTTSASSSTKKEDGTVYQNKRKKLDIAINSEAHPPLITDNVMLKTHTTTGTDLPQIEKNKLDKYIVKRPMLSFPADVGYADSMWNGEGMKEMALFFQGAMTDFKDVSDNEINDDDVLDSFDFKPYNDLANSNPTELSPSNGGTKKGKIIFLDFSLPPFRPQISHNTPIIIIIFFLPNLFLSILLGHH